MNNLDRKATQVVISLLIGMLSGFPALADDTEIYLGSNLGVNNAQPNVLFVVDTSGSMDNLVVTRPDYDPATNYGANPGACSEFTSDKIFTRTTTDCGTSSYFNASAFKCDRGVASLAATGFYQDRVAMWRYSWWTGGYRWRDISTSSSNRSKNVECMADQGVHGVDATSTSVWASNSSGPWSSTESNKVDWYSIGEVDTLYTGNYLNYLKTVPITSSKMRIDVVKDVVTDVVNSVTNIRIGLMRFDADSNSPAYEGGMVVWPMGSVNDDTVKTGFLAALNDMQPQGATPLSETMVEAGLYYQGGHVDYGKDSEDHTGALLPSHDNSRTPAGGPKYLTPIELQCQKNFIVYLTDGEPTWDSPSSTRLASVGAPTSCNGNCLDEIAGALAGKDQNADLAEVQRVSTYTIGFTIDQLLLSQTAEASKNASGAGKYYTADNTEELTNVFTNIITDILGVSSTFSSPAVSVNAFNRTSHRSDLYFTLFRPSTGPHWDGNFKRYKLTFLTDGTPVVTDAEDKAAVSDTTGYFRDEAVSFWTQGDDIPDGADAEEGGAASRLTNTRNVYTFTGTTLSLSDPSNRVHEDNSSLSTTLLGVDSQPDPVGYRIKLLQWARGLDVKDRDGDGEIDDARRIMGDPLHGQPALVQYGGLDTDPDLTAYVTTNDGYLHAFDTRLNQGTERFAFIPRELLDRLTVFYEDDANVQKPYGIDGTVVPWINDVDEDGIIESGDHVYIYFGMRRGGRNYYAMDVTDRNNPKLKWVIQGGLGMYTELGQTWSKPSLRKVELAGVDRHVLIFGGGYDVNQDAVSQRTPDGVGRAIYIVDADTGVLLWSASNQASADLTLPNMDYSIPSDIAALDTKGDGYVNMLFVGDMGGQIWRFDIERGETEGDLANLITGGRIADLSLDISEPDTRRFYYPPDAAILKNDKGNPYLALIISSGHRANPLNLNVNDRMYMIRPDLKVPTTYTTITEDDLYNTTSNVIGQGDTLAERDAANVALAGKKGWYIELEETGEKGLAKPLIFAGKAFITTYIPTDQSALGTTCMPSEGWGRLYIVNLSNGTPVFNFDTATVDDEHNLTKEDRIRTLNKAGIPADPIMIRTNDPNQTNGTICIGTECDEVRETNDRTSVYWYEQ